MTPSADTPILHRTVITSPVDGNAGARMLRVERLVTTGTQSTTVVPPHTSYVSPISRELD